MVSGRLVRTVAGVVVAAAAAERGGLTVTWGPSSFTITRGAAGRRGGTPAEGGETRTEKRLIRRRTERLSAFLFPRFYFSNDSSEFPGGGCLKAPNFHSTEPFTINVLDVECDSCEFGRSCRTSNVFNLIVVTLAYILLCLFFLSPWPLCPFCRGKGEGESRLLALLGLLSLLFHTFSSPSAQPQSMCIVPAISGFYKE